VAAKSVSEHDAEKPVCILALQGGGALGAYHIGAYQALAEQDFEPDWFSGISIGAINAAVLAGNPPEERLGRLEELWHAISWPELVMPSSLLPLASLQNSLSNAEALLLGQPNFFLPRPINPYLVPPGPPTTASFYDTSPLFGTLRRLARFDLINGKPEGGKPDGGKPNGIKQVRLTLGATDIETGDLVLFDNFRDVRPIGPEHVVASGSLPPGFPATEVDGRFYWDGGCVSNTPLEAVIADPPPGHAVVFMIDLWSAAGALPTTIGDVLWREKQIQYASRTAAHVDAVATKVNLRHAMRLMKQAKLPEVDAAVPDETFLRVGRRLDIVHIIYHPTEDQIPSSDAEFSRSSIAKRRQAGYDDMLLALKERPWHRAQKPAHLGAMVHRVKAGRVVTLPEPNLATTSDATGRPAA
jgi:NTE family protein